MNLIFFLFSATVKLDRYTIKDTPGSSGRLDVISRCILSAILSNNDFERNVQIWVFLDRYGTFIFNPEFFNYKYFPKNELRFTDYFVDFLQRSSNKDQPLNPLNTLKKSKKGILEAIRHFQKLDYKLFILQEQGRDFFKLLDSIQEQENIVFILGSQEDEFLNSEEILVLKIPTLSFGNQSYLASSIIRLLKLYVLGL
jgi:tRNA (pseudouridine54-N1)-methyltransferase